ncbi:DUF4386 domain-containing protein [Telluribacter sp. SYSU D00476]|uniref:DUF4386 domain-containing protein n=1 Tax=Telluribacter sp. SYSU D00476 TaxID=2811430 RepID=UPI001FF359EC|nr:DUF4386 domain-containing protein [Telluribacter sp. SYSU D00476]
MKTQTLARLIGSIFIIMFFLGVFAEAVVRGQLINLEDPRLTFTTVQESPGLFLLGIIAWIIIALLDAVLAVAFYVMFQSLHSPLAFLMTSLRLVYVAIKGVAVAGLLVASDIYSSAVGAEPGQTGMYATQAMLFLKMHHFGFGVGLIFFGFHLVLLAMLMRKTNGVPQWLVRLMLVAGIGYSMNSLVSFLPADFDQLHVLIIAVFIIPMTFAELSFGLWLWLRHRSSVLLPGSSV